MSQRTSGGLNARRTLALSSLHKQLTSKTKPGKGEFAGKLVSLTEHDTERIKKEITKLQSRINILS